MIQMTVINTIMKVKEETCIFNENFKTEKKKKKIINFFS